MKTLKYIVFAIFSIFYLLTASIYALPGITILRWIGSVLLICVIWLNNRNLYICFPRPFVLIIIALIPTFFGINQNSIFYSYERIISFFLVTISLLTFFEDNDTSMYTLQNYFEIYSSIVGVLMILSLARNFTLTDRMSGVYTNPNFLSCIAVFSTASSLTLFHLLQNEKRRWMYFSFFLASLVCVVGSGSRMGIGCLFIIVYMSPILSAKAYDFKHLFFQIIKILIITVIIVYILNRFDIIAIDRLLSDASSTSGATGLTRGDAWEDVYNIFSAKPIFGWGYATVGYNVFQVMDSTYNWGMHSSYFIILCEMGLVGSFLFLCFFISYIYRVYIRYKLTKNKTYSQKCFVKFLFLCCLVMLINAYSESFLFSVGNPMAVCFWLPFTMLYCYVNKFYFVEKEF